MPVLTEEERERTVPILDYVRAQIKAVAGDNRELKFQMQRYIAKRLEFDERGTPTQRRKLKDQKWKSQRGLCAICKSELPERGAELHRARAIDGYTSENTTLVCHSCHRNAQELSNFC